MTRLLEEAIARVAALPPAAQEQIGEELLTHVKKVNACELNSTRAFNRWIEVKVGR